MLHANKGNVFVLTYNILLFYLFIDIDAFGLTFYLPHLNTLFKILMNPRARG